MEERLSGRIGLIKELGIGVVALATVTSAVDGYYNGEVWNPPVNDPAYQREDQLRQEIDSIKTAIYKSRDARENAVRREQIIILDRDLYLSIDARTNRLRRPYLYLSRFFGSVLGGPISLGFGPYYLGKAYEFIRRRRSNASTSPQIG